MCDFYIIVVEVAINFIGLHRRVLMNFSLTLKATTLIFISAKEGL